jgi:hypothetical protein
MRESQPLSVSPDPRPQGPAASRSVAQDPVAVWTSRAFIQQAQSWVAAQLAPSGSRLTGEWDQPHARAWSSAIRFETTEGRVWFKVNAGGTAYEASLIALLGELNPGLAPDVIAHDEARVWSLTRDAGPVLRAIAEPDGLWGRWERLLPWYAEVQLALAEHRSRLLAAAVPDLGPNQLPVQYRRLLTELAGRAIDDGGLAPEQARALERVLPAYDGWCTELAASPIPDSLQHDDLHSNNVCWPGGVDDLSSVRIIDWGDASVGHPFGTMLATLNSIAFHAGALHVDRDMDPRVLRVRDAYLEPFTQLSRPEELRRWVDLARSTGCVTRAMAWERALQEAPRSVITEHEFPVRGWLLELLEPWADVG